MMAISASDSVGSRIAGSAASTICASNANYRHMICELFCTSKVSSAWAEHITDFVFSKSMFKRGYAFHEYIFLKSNLLNT